MSLDAKTLAVQYYVLFECKDGEILVTRTFNNSSDSEIVTKEISEIQEKCQHFSWNQPRLSKEIGKILFIIMNGDNQLRRALKEADAHGEPLKVFIQREDFVPDLPFELVYDSQFLVLLKIHVIRQVSDYGYKKEVHSESRPLKVLFMACSPQNVSPVLDFEKEEEIILDVTKNLPVDIDVEDTGSLQGLADRLEQNEYDVIHLTGHANIENGNPYFCMENEEGFLERVTPLQLQDALNEASKRPRLVFLSGCKTGEAPTAAVSFAHELAAEHSPTVVGWGLPVTDPGATTAAARLYHELSRGKSITEAVFSARQVLYKSDFSDWCLLRLFSDGTPLDIPLVEKGQKKKVKARDIQYAYLQNSQVKVLEKGFIGRRRQIQKGTRTLKSDKQKVGLLLHGTGGLGKSCLAGKFCDRFKDHALIVVHGELNAVTFSEALKQGFMRAKDEEGLQILQEEKEIPDKIMQLCTSCFQEKNYLIVLDDFEKNLEGYQQGNPVVSGKAAPILGTLLLFLPLAVKMSQLIITSRYTFPFTIQGKNLLKERLESIGLISFRGADEQKKVSELTHISGYPNEEVRQKLIAAGRGNPRLMEALNTLLEVQKVDHDLLSRVENAQEEFVQDLILREILRSQPTDFQTVMQYSSVFRLPALREGIQLVCKDLEDWKSSMDLGVQLSLMEEDKSGDMAYYWVTPLLREEIFEELSEKEKEWCHKAAVAYYKKILSLVEGYPPVYAFELVEHALQCDMDNVALEEGSKLLSYLRKTLAYTEALSEGEYILSQIPEPIEDEKFSSFLFQFGWIYHDIGDLRKAVTYYEKALEIDRIIYGENHPDVATRLNNLGLAWYTLGDPKKAIEYFEKALPIYREAYGETHPNVAITLNNLGLALKTLGDSEKAIEYFEKALKIDKKIYGENHPDVATRLNNLGSAWYTLGDPKKAIEYFEKALSILREAYGENHPYVATTLNNLGEAWRVLGDPKKAIEYCERALKIDKKIYGETHPDVARDLNNLGLAWYTLGDPKKAIEYCKRALKIDRKIYGENHPDVARDLNNLGLVLKTLGDPKKAIEYCERALKIDREIYGETHPDVARDLNNLGEVWYTLGDSEKAIEYYEKALEIDKKIYGENHPDVATRLNNLGSAWYTLGDPKKAIEYFEKALPIYREAYGETHPNVAITLNNLGLALKTLGDPKKAIEYCERALKIDRKIYGETHPDVARDLNNLGLAWYALGDSKKAVKYIQQAYTILQKVYGDQHPRTRTVKKLLDALRNSS